MSYKPLGYTAIGTAACAAMPQLYQIIKTKKVRDLNPCFFFLDCSASLMYIMYGILTDDYVMMGSAIMPFSSQLIILVLWCCYSKKSTIRENKKSTIRENKENQIDQKI